MAMTAFSPLVLEQLDQERGVRGLWRLAQDFRAVDPVRGPIDVPAGYVTDLASIPRLAMWLVPTAGRSAKAAVLHDYVLSRGVTENTLEQRRWATGIFDRALRSEGRGTLLRWLMVAFVAIGTLPDLYILGG